jgi:hypothetical protein
MTIRDIAMAFGYEVDRNSENRVNGSINKLKSVASKALGAIAIVFSIKGLSSLAEAAANAEALESRFTQVFGNMEEQASKTLNGIAKETGVVAGRMKGSFVQIAAFAKTSGMNTADSLDLSDRAMRAVADSAAFYDRSLEDVTGSLQSFLKGNYANDAALGLSATETTRNAAANALYGKSFKDLAEDQKQLTLLQMVEDANKLSGALGQASRESDTWGNRLGNLKQSLKDLQVAAGSAFLKPAIQVLKLISQLVGYAAKAIKDLTAEGRLLNRMFERFNNRVKKAQTYVEIFVGKVGGAENAFKLPAIAAASLIIAMNAGAILTFIKNLVGGLNLASLKVLLIAGIIALLVLAVDDFINFMKGNDSIIGALFEKWGIDADGVRKNVIETWDKIKVFLTTTWNAIKDIFRGVIQFISGVFTGDWEKAFGGLKSIVGSTFDYIDDVFGRFAPIVKVLTVGIAALCGIMTLNSVAVTVNTAAQKAWNFAAKAGRGIAKGLGAAFKFMTSPLGIAVLIIGALAAVIALLIKNGGNVDEPVQKFTDGLDNVIGIVEKVIAGIADKAPQIIQAITVAITKVLSVITEKLPMFIDIGVKLITSLIQGLVTMLPKIIDIIIILVTALIGAIVDFLPKLIDTGIKILLALIEGIVSIIPQLITAVVKLIPVIIKAIAGALPKLIKAGIQIILSLIQGIVKASSQIIRAVVELIPTVINALLSTLPQIIEAGIQIAISLSKGLIQAIPELLKAILEIIGAVLDGFAELFPGLAPIIR